jgi:enterochelin esterase family protein
MVRINGQRVRFQPPTGAAYLIGDFTDWRQRPLPVNGPIELSFPPGTYIEYAYLDARRAPLADVDNPNVPSHPWHAHDRFVQLPAIADVSPSNVAAPARGHLDEVRLISRALGGPRIHTLYEPPQPPLSTLYVLDGEKYVTNLELHHVCDALLASRLVEPLRIIFMHAHEREREYRFCPKHERYLVDELMPSVAERVVPTPRAAIWGASLGGLTAAWYAYRYPTVFSAVGMQSACLTAKPGGADNYHEPEWLTGRYAKAPPRPTCFYLDTGTIEWLLPANRRFAAVLADQGIDHLYREWPGGHSWHTWGRGLAIGIRFLFPPQADESAIA